MDKKRSRSCDQAATSSPDPPKRQRTLRRNPSDALPQDQYTIAWICALYIEMAAARAMLDEIHEDLPQDANDKNTYMLGSIGPHNILIACLPNGHYGTNNAASVLTHLLRSFTSVRKGFMVGIGGGVPSTADIRLGDVVVGTRVMQYDLGKIVDDGKIQRTANARIPDSSFGTAVSAMRTLHEEGPSRMSIILQNMTANNPEYGYPASPDRLFSASYKHESQLLSCSSCDQSKLLSGSTRMPNHPKIHHGAIASGNQVIKDSITRDTIARELDIICFEMEAAGLMDVLPCLPIRGICDYADSHKSKEWQRYAAATAAACAKELIEILPAHSAVLENGSIHNSPSPNQSTSPNASPNRRQLLLESLKFEKIDSRKTSIKKADFKTCRWFLKHPQYLEWLDPQNRAHRGFLWIRGKPGAGKSTIMKFIYEKMKKKNRQKHAITASFFFHARGEDLEKSIPGMYRSLLLQLFEGYPDLQDVLDDTDLVPRGQTGCPSLNVLKDLFHNAVSNLGQRTFTCFVDALDECDEQQVMEMVRNFEELAESCEDTGSHLQICFSSRHYPYIRIQHGIELTLEHQQGHYEDMSNYIQSNLRVASPALVEKLRTQMLEKAAGVFLWVALVVDILNKESRRSGLALQKRLAEVPSRLSDLFKDILTRDTDNMDDLLLSVLWILYAKRPLRPEEYYHALWSGLVQKDLVDPEMPDTGPDSNDCIRSYVIASSKGLAEIPRVKSPTVQFIHESVRDFLIKDRGLQDLWPDLGSEWQVLGHDKLKQCCISYINHELVRASVSSFAPTTPSDDLLKVSEQYPFLEYASQYVLYHSDAAARLIPQAEFLSQTSTPDWVTTVNLFERFKKRKYSSEASLIYILADKGFSALIRTWLQNNPSIDIRGERYEHPLFAAVANGHKDAVAALLDSTSSICEGVDTVEGFGSKTGFVKYKRRTSLTWAAQEGLTSVVELLVQKGADVNGIDQEDYTPLMRASEAGHQAVVSFLIKEGAAVESPYAHRAVSLALKNGRASILKLFTKANVNWDLDPETLRMGLKSASERKNEEMVKLLIEDGVEPDAQDSWSHTALSLASKNYHAATLKLLIERNADWDFNSKDMQTAFMTSAAVGNDEMVKLLVEKGVIIGAQSSEGYTALTFASRNSHLSTVKLLIENGAQIEPDLRGETPRPALIEASTNGHEAKVKFLLEIGAEPNACDCEGHTAISRASYWGHSAIVKLLIESGAHINPDARGCNPKPALIEASIMGRVELVRLLLEKGANIETRDENGRTPLIAASIRGHETLASLLIEQGANVNAQDKVGKSPLHRIMDGNPHYVSSICESLTNLLLRNEATVDARDSSGQTPLLTACRYGRKVPQRLLIEQGADVNARDKEGYTPLFWACGFGEPSGEPLLLIEKGADINAKTEQGKTPLHMVCETYDLQSIRALVRVLIDEGADIHARNREGSTPLHLAVTRRKHQVAKLLIERGAHVDDPVRLALKGL
ncbi:hypothetical protein NW767_006319 [Fusarium falciforme]|nr:hypothetical protein NW767_006319 [Fusarium falciforme]